jgi:hypothetical protein
MYTQANERLEKSWYVAVWSEVFLAYTSGLSKDVIETAKTGSRLTHVYDFQ